MAEHTVEMKNFNADINFYKELIGSEHYDDAFNFFEAHLGETLFYHLSDNRQRAELLELLFPDGTDQLPRLAGPQTQGVAIHALALSYQMLGQPGRAVRLYRLAATLIFEEANLCNCLTNLGETLRVSGALREAEGAVRKGLSLAKLAALKYGGHFGEAAALCIWGHVLATRGMADEAAARLRQVSQVYSGESKDLMELVVSTYRAQCELWLFNYAAANSLAERARALASSNRIERLTIESLRIQGAAELGAGNLAMAENHLQQALTNASAIGHVEEVLPSLVGLAELRRQQRRLKDSRELLEQVWEPAERGPYPLFRADALNVLAQIERGEGNIDKAIEAATQAYRSAWCDGPPFAYRWGLEAARRHLGALSTAEPQMPPFDESKYETIPNDTDLISRPNDHLN
jgi:tetratricopeptide (TPR) repeat protein